VIALRQHPIFKQWGQIRGSRNARADKAAAFAYRDGSVSKRRASRSASNSTSQHNSSLTGWSASDRSFSGSERITSRDTDSAACSHD